METEGNLNKKQKLSNAAESWVSLFIYVNYFFPFRCDDFNKITLSTCLLNFKKQQLMSCQPESNALAFLILASLASCSLAPHLKPCWLVFANFT